MVHVRIPRYRWKEIRVGFYDTNHTCVGIEEPEETLEYENDDDEIHRAVPGQRFLGLVYDNNITDLFRNTMDPDHLQMEKCWNEIRTTPVPVDLGTGVPAPASR